MANVLTDLAADIYKAADIVGRELVGFIPSVTINAGAERAAFGDTVRSHFTRTPTVNTSYSPSMTIPEGDDQTVDNKTMTIDKVANIQIPWTGEDIRHVNNGSGFETIYGDQIAQAMRSITNAIEAEVGSVLYKGASRAVGAAGTNPFASNFDVVADARKVLEDNGCPMDGRITMVCNTAATAAMRKLAQLQKANESASDALLRRGELLDLQGVMIKGSGGVASHTKGTGSGYLINGGDAVGDETITVDTGAGTILAGDVITHASDSTNKYVVITALSGGDFVIGSPGLLVAAADNDAVTVGDGYAANVAFHQAAVELVARAPEQPFGGDAAIDRMTVQDTFSGLVYEVAVYKGYGKAMIDVTTFYAAKVWKPDFVTTVMG